MVVKDQFLAQYIGALRDALDEVAHGSCKLPKSDPFEHGVQVGWYRGLNAALRLLEATIEDEAEKERKS